MQEKACDHKTRHDKTGQWRENWLHVLHWMNCRYLNCAIGPIYGVPVIYLSTNLNIPIWELEYIYNESEEWIFENKGRNFESEDDTTPAPPCLSLSLSLSHRPPPHAILPSFPSPFLFLLNSLAVFVLFLCFILVLTCLALRTWLWSRRCRPAFGDLRLEALWPCSRS
jgi:hypothetical protein